MNEFAQEEEEKKSVPLTYSRDVNEWVMGDEENKSSSLSYSRIVNEWEQEEDNKNEKQESSRIHISSVSSIDILDESFFKNRRRLHPLTNHDTNERKQSVRGVQTVAKKQALFE